MEETPGSRAPPPQYFSRSQNKPPADPGPAIRGCPPAAAPLPPPQGADLGASPPPVRSPGQAEAPPHPGGRSPPGRSCGNRAAGSAGNSTASLPLSPASTFPAAGGRRAAPGSGWGEGEGKEVGPSGSQAAPGAEGAARAGPPEPPRSSLTRCRPCGGRF